MISDNQSIKEYIDLLFGNEDEVLLSCKEQGSSFFKIPMQEVPPHVGKLLYLLTKMRRPRKVLEIGTLCGYSTLWLARALPKDGYVVSLEHEAQFVEKAKKNIQKAGFENQVEIRFGKAIDSLQKMCETKEGPFDVIFIDADKKSYPLYLEYAIALASNEALLLVDNLIPRNSSHIEKEHHVAFNQAFASHPQLETAMIPSLRGTNGRIDGLGIALVIKKIE